MVSVSVYEKALRHAQYISISRDTVRYAHISTHFLRLFQTTQIFLKHINRRMLNSGFHFNPQDRERPKGRRKKLNHSKRQIQLKSVVLNI